MPHRPVTANLLLPRPVLKREQKRRRTDRGSYSPAGVLPAEGTQVYGQLPAFSPVSCRCPTRQEGLSQRGRPLAPAQAALAPPRCVRRPAPPLRHLLGSFHSGEKNINVDFT